jgi:hypothetical protein
MENEKKPLLQRDAEGAALCFLVAQGIRREILGLALFEFRGSD